jgi:hypothetical protein
MSSQRERCGPRAGVALAAALMVAIAAAPGAWAAPIEAIAGWEGDSFRQGYGFLTAGVLLGEGGPLVVPIRVSGSYLEYDYEEDGVEISLRSPGTSMVAGLRSVSPRATLTALVGGEVRWERRERPGSGPSETVARGGLIAQGEADLTLGRRLRPFLLASYSGSARYLYGRALVRWQCSNLDWSQPATWFVGLEAVGQGNADTDAVQAGAAVECAIEPARLSLGLHAGYKNAARSESERREGAYFGVGVYRRF